MSALSNKHKKRIDKKFLRVSEKIDVLYTMIVAWLFVAFCIVLLFDQVVGKIFFPFIRLSPGVGAFQYVVAGGLLATMWVLKKNMK